MSYIWFTGLGLLVCVIFGLIVSFITGNDNNKQILVFTVSHYNQQYVNIQSSLFEFCIQFSANYQKKLPI